MRKKRDPVLPGGIRLGQNKHENHRKRLEKIRDFLFNNFLSRRLIRNARISIYINTYEMRSCNIDSHKAAFEYATA